MSRWWWMLDSSDEENWVDALEHSTHARPISFFDPECPGCLFTPTTLNIPHVDTVTNARIKRYISKEVLQVANDTIFSVGDFELHNSTRKRLYDVSRPGEAKDPERSLEESKRRAKSKVRDIALCNRFTHMFTWTLDPELVDRYDAEKVYKKVRTFLSNSSQRKGFRYVCIPEYHTLKSGESKPGIHMHGLCVPGDVKLVPSVRKNGSLRLDPYGRQIYNMEDWSLGWSTCVSLDENYERAVNYVSKYITKAHTKIFGKWYLSSRSLVKAPDIVSLEPMDFESFRDEKKLKNHQQMETSVYLDVKILSEEYDKEGNFL